MDPSSIKDFKAYLIAFTTDFHDELLKRLTTDPTTSELAKLIFGGAGFATGALVGGVTGAPELCGSVAKNVADFLFTKYMKHKNRKLMDQIGSVFDTGPTAVTENRRQLSQGGLYIFISYWYQFGKLVKQNETNRKKIVKEAVDRVFNDILNKLKNNQLEGITYDVIANGAFYGKSKANPKEVIGSKFSTTELFENPGFMDKGKEFKLINGDCGKPTEFGYRRIFPWDVGKFRNTNKPIHTDYYPLGSEHPKGWDSLLEQVLSEVVQNTKPSGEKLDHIMEIVKGFGPKLEKSENKNNRKFNDLENEITKIKAYCDSLSEYSYCPLYPNLYLVEAEMKLVSQQNQQNLELSVLQDIRQSLEKYLDFNNQVFEQIKELHINKPKEPIPNPVLVKKPSREIVTIGSEKSKEKVVQKRDRKWCGRTCICCTNIFILMAIAIVGLTGVLILTREKMNDCKKSQACPVCNNSGKAGCPGPFSCSECHTTTSKIICETKCPESIKNEYYPDHRDCRTCMESCNRVGEGCKFPYFPNDGNCTECKESCDRVGKGYKFPDHPDHRECRTCMESCNRVGEGCKFPYFPNDGNCTECKGSCDRVGKGYKFPDHPDHRDCRTCKESCNRVGEGYKFPYFPNDGNCTECKGSCDRVGKGYKFPDHPEDSACIECHTSCGRIGKGVFSMCLAGNDGYGRQGWNCIFPDRGGLGNYFVVRQGF